MKKIFYVTNDPERALGLENVLENFHIICTDANKISESLQNSEVEIFSLEKELRSKNPIFRNSNKLLQRKEVQEYIEENSDEGDQVYIMVFKISPGLERTIEKYSYRSLNTTSKLNKQFEDKISQLHFLQEIDVNIPRSKIVKLGRLDKNTKGFDLPFVIQYDRGHTGEGTIFVEDEGMVKELTNKYPEREVKISEYIQGDAWTINAVVTRYGIFYSGLSKQLTGITELTNKKGATVGNDWTETKALSSEVISQIEDMTEKVGRGMANDGYMGLFGLDFIIKQNKVYLIEINARQPASTGMHTKLMLRNNEIPLMLLHIAEFLTDSDVEYLNYINHSLGEKYDKQSLSEQLNTQNHRLGEGYEASQFILRNDTESRVLFDGMVRSGVYRDKVYQHDGYSIDDVTDDCEFILNCVPKGRAVTPGTEIARIQALHTVLSSHGKLKDHYIRMIRSIREKMKESKNKTETMELPDDIKAYIDRYLGLNIVGKEITTPYYRNVKRVRAGLRALLGKGTPDEIEEETLIYAKLRSYSLSESSPEEIRKFMESQGIGIDCSGFVSHVYAYWLAKRGKSRLDNHLHFPNESFKRKIIRKFRYIENISSDLLTNEHNASKVNIDEIKPGDLLRLKGTQRGDHIAMIYDVQKDGEESRSFTYVHSSPYYGKENGLRFGTVEITDPEKGLKDQQWNEIDPKTNENYTLMGLEREYDDNGLRRPNFSDLLK